MDPVYSADYANLRDNGVALNQLDNISMYRTVFASDNLPKNGSGNTGQNSFYDYADTTPITTDNRGWSGAIFYGQLTNKNTNETEWVLVDTPNYHGTNVYQLGISRNGKVEDVVNRVITGSNVYTSYSSANMPLFSGVAADADGVKALENTNVVLEFWSFNYSRTAEASKLDQNGNAFTLSTNNAGGYDWNDTINLKDGKPTGDHGSWQIHVYDSTAQQGQSLFSMSRLYRTGESIDAGIGDAYTTSGKENDWTMVGNAASYDGRAMTVLAKPNYVAGDMIFNANGATSDWGTASNWLNEAGATATATPTNVSNVYVNMGDVTISGSATAKTLNLDHSASVMVQKNGALAIGSGFNIEGTFNSAGDTTVNGTANIGLNGNYGVLNLNGGTFKAHNIYYANQNRTASGTIQDTIITHTNGGNVGNFNIAAEAGSSVTVTVDGTSIINASNFNVGYRGNGTLILNDGTINAGSYYCVGNNIANAHGTVYQYGGTVNAAWAPLGHNGQAEYHLYGGSLITTSREVTLGDNASGVGIFNMYDGYVESQKSVLIGHNGKGTLIQSGGDILAKERITLGQNASGVGTWTMTGGTARVTDIAVGHAGSGTFNLYDGEITASGWVLVGFTNGKDFETRNTLNMYGGTINTNWFTMGWDYETSDGTMNMYGGELKTTGGNGIILAKTGSAEFNLYNGTVTSNTQLRLGQEAVGVGDLNIYAGDITAKGNANMNANSSINFRTNSLGMGSLTVDGSFTQNNGQVTFGVSDGLTFIDGYSVEDGIDIMTVGGKNAVTVTNETPDMATVAYDTNTGKLNMKLNSDLSRGSMIAENSSIQLDGDGATQGWVTLEGVHVGDPYILSLVVDTNDMDLATFVNNLNETLKIGDESFLIAEFNDDSSVSMTLMPDLVAMMNSDVFAWNFTDTALFGANGVSVLGVSMNAVPEPATWGLLVLGIGLIIGLHRKRS